METPKPVSIPYRLFSYKSRAFFINPIYKRHFYKCNNRAINGMIKKKTYKITTNNFVVLIHFKWVKGVPKG